MSRYFRNISNTQPKSPSPSFTPRSLRLKQLNIKRIPDGLAVNLLTPRRNARTPRIFAKAFAGPGPASREFDATRGIRHDDAAKIAKTSRVFRGRHAQNPLRDSTPLARSLGMRKIHLNGEISGGEARSGRGGGEGGGDAARN